MPSRICFLGKYPPIEGGVSASSYWTVRGLAERGHRIVVVTNAQEVEAEYRLLLRPEDSSWLEPTFRNSGGFVRLAQTQSFGPSTYHVPAANPYLSKLAGIAIDVIRDGFDLVIARYFEPYGVAGFLASRVTGAKFVVAHSGSDLELLMRSPQLASVYREMSRTADAVLTVPGLENRFADLGVSPARIVAEPAFALPTEHFNPHGERLKTTIRAPTIGLYGKVGRVKGSFDLLAALVRLRRAGRDFQLLAPLAGEQRADFEREVVNLGLADAVQTLPPLPHWHVPAFLRSCTAVCVLERGFPIELHGPLTPREVLACGTCLVVSAEVAAKQPLPQALRNGEDALIVNDPRDHDELAAVLAAVIDQPSFARRVAQAGTAVAAGSEDFQGYLDQFESLLGGVSNTFPARPLPTPTQVITLATAAPLLAAIARVDLESLASSAGIVGAEATESAYRLCCMLQDPNPQSKWLVDEVDQARAKIVLALQVAELWLRLLPRRGGWALQAPDLHAGLTPRTDTIAGLRPKRTFGCRVEQFSFDVRSLLRELTKGAEANELRQAVVDLEPAVCETCFVVRPNASRTRFILSPSVADLIRRCDGTQTCSKLEEWMLPDEPRRAEILLPVWQRLYEAAAITLT